jgi:hypothetical protein
MVPRGAVQFTKGTELVSRYELPDAGYATNFCRVCGCSVPAARPNDDHPVDGVPLGSLDDDAERPPVGHIFVASKAPWHTITDELPQVEELPSPEDMARLTSS